MQPKKNSILSHLNFLFANTPKQFQDGRIEIAYTGANIKSLNQANYFGLDEIEKAADFIVQKNSVKGINVYVGAALRKPDCPPFGRSSLNDYYAATALWVDIDDKEAAESAKTIYEALPPSFIVVTGRNPHKRFQAWWKLDMPEENNSKLKIALSGLQHALKGDPSVVDAARVMRVGGTVAWPKKDGRVTEATETYELNELNNSVFNIVDVTFTYPPALTQDIHTGQSVIDDGKPRNIFTGQLEVVKLLEATKQQGHWNENMLVAIGSMVGRHWSDEQIRLACAPYSHGAHNDQDIIDIINRTRVKFAVPNPEFNPETGEIIEQQKLYYINAPDVIFEPTSNDFVQGLLTESALSVVYGESNCGKTFFMTDLAFHIVEGKRWRDRRVEKGAVLYLCLEGAYGIKGRIQAYKNENNTNLDGFLLMPCAVNFMDPKGAIPQLELLIQKANSEHGAIKMVVVDTLARALSGADENSGQDMGALVANADYIRNSTGAHVCFIHHSGKDRALGARGHSSLRAAVDTEIEVHRSETDKYSTVKVVKQREMEPLEDMAFALKSVTIGINQYFEEIKSCVVEEVEAKEKTTTLRMNDIQAFLYKCLKIAVQDHAIGKQVYGKDGPFVQCVTYDQLREVMEENGFKEVMETANKTSAQQIKSATQSARLYLQRNNKISFDGSYIWLMNNDEN